jgi:hypothetical protein
MPESTPTATPLPDPHRIAGTTMTTFGNWDPQSRSATARALPHASHTLHSGVMCLAFLRLGGALLIALLLLTAFRGSGHTSRFLRPSPILSGRSPPGDPSRLPTPSLAQLCVLRR